jgi:hypothetical protein
LGLEKKKTTTTTNERTNERTNSTGGMGLQKSGELDRKVATGNAATSETAFYGGAADAFASSAAVAANVTLRVASASAASAASSDAVAAVLGSTNPLSSTSGSSADPNPVGFGDSQRGGRDGDGDGDGDGGRRVRRYVTTTKQLGDGYLSPLNKKYSKMSEAQLEQVIIKESERFKLEMALWDEQLEALNNTAAAAEEEQRVVASEQAVLLASMKQWDSRSQKDKLSAKNASSGRPLEDGSVALTR